MSARHPWPAACSGCPARADALGYVPPSGPPSSPCLMIAQGPGRNELEGGAPLIGRSGQRLTRWAIQADFPKREARLDNVVRCHLPENRPPKEAEISFCRAAHWGKELSGRRLIVAIGMPAIKAVLLPKATMSDTCRFVRLGPDQYGIGLVHPSAILKGQWGRDPFQANALRRARRVLQGEDPYIPDWSNPAPKTNMWPTLAELIRWEVALGPKGFALDVEAAGNVLRLVGLRSLDSLEGVEIGFRDEACEPWVFCPECRGLEPQHTHPRDDFSAVVHWLARLLADSSVPKTMQNGQAYDIPEQLENVGFVVRGFKWDTLLMAHIRQPEMPKGLEELSQNFLGLGGWKYLSGAEAEGDNK